jgi:hypothetical protein
MDVNRKMLIAVEKNLNPSFSKIFGIRGRYDVPGRLPVKGLGNVEVIRVNDGATGALHQACLRKTSDLEIG